MRSALSTPLSLCLLLVFAVPCSANMLQKSFHDLDKAISLSPTYRSNFETRMDAARKSLERAETDSLRWECAYELFSGYSLLNNDSTLFYLSKMGEYSYDYPDLQLLTRVCRSEMYSLTGDMSRFNNTIPLLLGKDVPESIEARYYSIIIDSYSNFPFQEGYKDIDLLDRAIGVESLPENLKLYYNGLREIAYNDNQSALDYLNRAFEVSSAPYIKACIAASIATVYHDWEVREMEEYWLSEASALFIRTPAVIPSSLYQLAMMLFEDNELERAARYTRFVLVNALDSQYTDKVINTTRAQLSLMDSLKSKEEARSKAYMLAFAVLLVAIAVALYLWRRSASDRRSAIISREELRSSNERLFEANSIKEGVMFKYMLLAVKYLNESDGLRRRFNKILKEEGEESLKKALRDPTQSEPRYREFYKEFDSTFLGLYPDFISKVNRLFPEETQFKEADSLTTQLRILAVIKLGLTDSGQIAGFLNCSPSSVYTHRSRMKHLSLCESEEFEDKIQSI